VLGSASRVSTCVEDAKISLCTGRIALGRLNDQPPTRWCDSSYARRGADYLLC
jgi:hypothetical protein